MKTRTYTMTVRADAAEATRAAILHAAVGLSMERFLDAISLDDVAERAGVSVQTVLRRFGNRQGLLEAAFDHGREAVQEERRTPPGDVTAAVAVLVAHYEKRGDGVLTMLAQEGANPTIRRITRSGKAQHRRWVRDAFGPLLPADRGPRDEAVDLLVVATDVYTWKLLRRDRGLGRARTTQRMEQLARAVLVAVGSSLPEET